MRRWLVPVLVCACLGAARPAPQEQAEKENPAHAELRDLKRHVEQAFNNRDIDDLLRYLSKDVILTWQDAEVSRGRDGVRAYYNKMMVGDQRVVDETRSEAAVDDLSSLYGPDTAVSAGDLKQHFKLRNGMEFDLSSRWTATTVKENGRWRIASFHVSANLFDNPVLGVAVRRTGYLVGAVALVVGVALGWLLARFVRARRPIA